MSIGIAAAPRDGSTADELLSAADRAMYEAKRRGKGGFVIHAAIHANRPDAHCIIHTHTTAGIAVACKKDGLRYDNFYSAQFFGRLASPDKQMVVMPGADHAAQLEDTHDAWISAVVNFLNRPAVKR